MNAARIIQDKGSDVFTIRPSASLLDAASELKTRGIGAVVVTEDHGPPVGVFSERDLVCALADAGPSALSQPVADHMSRDLVTAAPDTTIETLMGVMTDRRVRHVVVLNSGSLAGVVSIGDVVKRKIAQAEADAQAMKAYIETA